MKLAALFSKGTRFVRLSDCVGLAIRARPGKLVEPRSASNTRRHGHPVRPLPFARWQRAPHVCQRRKTLLAPRGVTTRRAAAAALPGPCDLASAPVFAIKELFVVRNVANSLVAVA